MIYQKIVSFKITAKEYLFSLYEYIYYVISFMVKHRGAHVYPQFRCLWTWILYICIELFEIVTKLNTSTTTHTTSSSDITFTALYLQLQYYCKLGLTIRHFSFHILKWKRSISYALMSCEVFIVLNVLYAYTLSSRTKRHVLLEIPVTIINQNKSAHTLLIFFHN